MLVFAPLSLSEKIRAKLGSGRQCHYHTPLLFTTGPVNREVNTFDHVDILINAARAANEETIMTLFLKQLDLTCVDEDGNTALHIAAMNGHAFICRMLVVLASPVRMWEMKNNAGLTAEDLTTDQRVKQDLQLLRKGDARVEDEFTRLNDELIQQTTKWKENGKVLLALDGGGVKALVVTQFTWRVWKGSLHKVCVSKATRL
ncbi:hypothetical protein ANCDUO_01489 [Ancylostoma duodenale]|uniref:Uncharacterized protein n=1 Tax=Ancylostoma duodenale TaxID=51022 RepID=A0A0C2DYS2_9BILA|nr:hypothetical protein ANCDUO_01489 [Ancylostoma duodenale]